MNFLPKSFHQHSLFQAIRLVFRLNLGCILCLLCMLCMLYYLRLMPVTAFETCAPKQRISIAKNTMLSFFKVDFLISASFYEIIIPNLRWAVNTLFLKVLKFVFVF